MFSFLNSTVLVAALAALVPLIIHLFSKRRVMIVEFSSLRHLKAMQKRQVRRLKIRQLLLLILRMLIILLVVIAFARPTMTGGAIGSHAAVSAAILLDNSGSMDRYVSDGNLFEIARKRTKELLGTFGEADEVVLISLAEDAETAAAGLRLSSSAVALKQLQQFTAGSAVADLESALDKASDLLGLATSLNKEIHVITDRQRCSLPERTVPIESDARVVLMDLPDEGNENCGITAVDFGGQLLIPGHDFDVTATVKNYGSSDRADLIASLFLDGNRVAQTDVKAAAGQETVARFTRSVSRTGFHSGWVELSDDKFRGDNLYYFSFHIPNRFNLLIVRGEAAADFISLALVPSRSINQYWSVKEVDPENLSGVSFRDYDVVVLSGAPDLQGVYVDRLAAYVDRGGSLFVIYGGDTDIRHFNEHLSGMTGIIYDEPIKQDFSRAGYYTISSLDSEHPVFSVFGFERSELPQVKFYALPIMHTAPGARVLMRFSGDRPALVENSYGTGGVLTFTGPMAPDYGDLVSHAFFVPFISRVAEYLASDLSGYDLQLYVGDNISRSVSVRGSVGIPLQLVTPDSSVHSVLPEEGRGSLVFHPQPTSQVGIYRVNYLGREIDRFAVNLRPAEGDLTSADPDQWAASLGVEEYDILEQGRDMISIISEFRFGKELWPIFLWATVILLVFEILLSRGAAPEEPG